MLCDEVVFCDEMRNLLHVTPSLLSNSGNDRCNLEIIWITMLASTLNTNVTSMSFCGAAATFGLPSYS